MKPPGQAIRDLANAGNALAGYCYQASKDPNLPAHMRKSLAAAVREWDATERRYCK